MENNSDDWKPTFRGATWNLIINIALACFFYIYAFNNPDAGSCFAKDGFETARAEVPISVPATSSSEAVFATGYHEMSAKFETWFIAGFVLSCSVILYSLLSYIYLMTDAEAIAVFSEVLGFVTQMSTFVWLVYGSYIRWSHGGRVCSGAYADESDSKTKAAPYQWQSGLFMKIYIGTMTFLLVAVIAFGCVSQAYDQC